MGKRPRFSMEPDLEIEVEGQIFQVHSYPVMEASLVFRKMLQNDMVEAQSGRITLNGKSKEEFDQVRLWLTIGRSQPKVTKDHLSMLLRWADEYEIEHMLQACEKYLLKQPSASVK